MPASPTPPPVKPFASSLLRSLYADNARVYYKTHSLSRSIGGTVRNSHAVGRRT